MLMDRRERPLGLGVCVCGGVCVCWPSRPCAATARLGLLARRLVGSPPPPPPSSLPLSVWAPARLLRSR